MNERFARWAGAGFVLLLPAACAARDAAGPASPPAAGISQPGDARSAFLRSGGVSGGKIKHVVYIIQENRSFNNLFLGFKGANTQDYGYDTSGNKIVLHPQSLATTWDIDHSTIGFFAAYDNGKLDGWNNEGGCCKLPPYYAYAYVPRNEIKPYWDMAEQYALADNLLQSNLDGSFVAHQYAIAAASNHEVNFPTSWWGCQAGPSDTVTTLNSDRTIGPSVPVCEDYPTLGDSLDAASLSWRFYTYPYDTDGGIWNAYSAVNHIYSGPDYQNDVIEDASQFIPDVAKRTLSAVTWITPTYENSDHAGYNGAGGPAWVASLVNAVGKSPFWDSTAIFVIWDDWGGWFDPVAPIYEDYDGLGFRVPMIAISAYAKKGYVSHVQYESSSVLRFMEDNFGLSPLAASDARAADPASDMFDFSQRPRPFKRIAAKAVETPRWNGRRLPVNGD
jgi:phospholipase C